MKSHLEDEATKY
jgi:hypothetical protein